MDGWDISQTTRNARAPGAMAVLITTLISPITPESGKMSAFKWPFGNYKFSKVVLLKSTFD